MMRIEVRSIYLDIYIRTVSNLSFPRFVPVQLSAVGIAAAFARAWFGVVLEFSTCVSI